MKCDLISEYVQQKIKKYVHKCRHSRRRNSTAETHSTIKTSSANNQPISKRPKAPGSENTKSSPHGDTRLRDTLTLHKRPYRSKSLTMSLSNTWSHRVYKPRLVSHQNTQSTIPSSEHLVICPYLQQYIYMYIYVI